MPTSREKVTVKCHVDKPRDKGQGTGIALSSPDPGATYLLYDGLGFDRRLLTRLDRGIGTGVLRTGRHGQIAGCSFTPAEAEAEAAAQELGSRATRVRVRPWSNKIWKSEPC